MRRRNSFFLCAIGVLMLVYGIWSIYVGLFDLKTERIETYQAHTSIGTMESYGIPAYVHANEGDGTMYRLGLAIRIEYRMVNGTLHIDHYYSDFGEVAAQPTLKLGESTVTGNGSTIFEIEHNFVGVHELIFTPDYEPNYSPVEVWIYSIHYELRPQRDTVIFGLALSSIGTVLAATMLATVANGNSAYHEPKKQTNATSTNNHANTE